MLNTVEEQIIHSMKANRDVLLNNWAEKVIIKPSDPFKDSVRKNGLTMFNLLIRFLTSGIDEGKLQDLAAKISLERLQAKINIAEYVYNVNLGRSEVISYLLSLDCPNKEIHPIIDKVNVYFDTFLYFTVKHYTDKKDKLLQEQSTYIEHTHKDRLTILGQMSSSFVHEFRNPLTSVIGFVQLLQEKYPSLEYLDILMTELNQLKFRINQFLMASKKEVKDNDKEVFHIATILDETLDFLYPLLLSSEVEVEQDIDRSIRLYGYRAEFRQVLINIIMNSLDALSECQNKSICIKGYQDTTSNTATIRISNNGPAISQDVIQSIFEPFVSTKKLGTGIGLYICRKIIEEHGGTIHCESNQDWTSFQIELPTRNRIG